MSASASCLKQGMVPFAQDMGRFLLFLGGVLVLLGIGVWFWGLGSLPPLPVAFLTLKIEHTPVEILSSDTKSWNEAKDGMTLQIGDTIRTGQGGRAAIQIFDQGEIRLQSDTEFVVSEFARNEAQPEKIVFDGRLLRGRVWSRLLRLFDLDSSFSIRSSDVVATVRGTSFDMGVNASGTSVWVWDAVVELAPSSTSTLAVPQGYMVESGTWAISPISEEDKTTEWVKDNRHKDEEFLQGSVRRLEEHWKSTGISYGNQAFSTLRRWSEGLHLFFVSQEDVSSVTVRSLERRLYGIHLLIAEGKSGLAYQHLNRLEEEIESHVLSQDRDLPLTALFSSFVRIGFFLSSELPSSPHYRFKQRLEDLSERILRDDPASSLFVRLLAVDTRLDEAVLLLNARALEEASLTVDTAKQGLQTIEREAKNGMSRLEKKKSDLLWSKLQALKAREDVIRRTIFETVNAPENLDPSLPGTTSTLPGLETSTTTLSTQPSLPEESTIYKMLILSAQPNPVMVGESATLVLIGTREDGAVVDLTSQARLSVASGTGLLLGPVYSPRVAGAVTLQAVLKQGEEAHQIKTVLQVLESKKLSGLELVAQGATTVRSGVEVPLIVKAKYANGETKIVTPKVQWQTSDASVGSVTDGIFHAWIKGHGQVKITALYTEDAITQTTSIIFTVNDGAL